MNWFEAAQLVVSALAVPLLARLGDLVGARNVLLLSTAITADRLVGAGLRARVHDVPGRIRGSGCVRRVAADGGRDRLSTHVRIDARRDLLTRRAAAILVGALELSVIIGALTSGALVDATSMTVVLMIPAVVVTAVLVVIWFGIERDPSAPRVVASTSAASRCSVVVLGLVMGGLIAIRLQGPGHPLGWLLIVAGARDARGRSPATRHGRREPLVDVRLFASPLQWPVQLTAFLFGVSVLGAQIPLSTFARTDPDVAGYGLGASAGFVSTLIGVYVVFLAVGAFTLPLTTRWLGARGALVLSAVLVALGLCPVVALCTARPVRRWSTWRSSGVGSGRARGGTSGQRGGRSARRTARASPPA